MAYEPSRDSSRLSGFVLSGLYQRHPAVPKSRPSQLHRILHQRHTIRKGDDHIENTTHFETLIEVANDPTLPTWEQKGAKLNLLFNQHYDPSKWRKDYALFQKAADYITKTNHPALHESLQEAKDSLFKESYKLKRHNTLRRKLLREQAQVDLVIEAALDSISPYQQRPPALNTELPIEALPDFQGHILTLADAHYGRTGVSTRAQLQDVLKQALRYIRAYDVKHLHVLVLGDMIDGLLRTSQFQFIEKLPLDQVFDFSDIFASFIEELSTFTKLTVHYSTSANHTEVRPLNSNRLDFKSEDYERVIAKFLQKTLPFIPIKTYDEGIIDFKLGDFNIIALHGHQFSKKAGQLQNLSFTRDKKYDYMFYGHYHHEKMETIAEAKAHNIQAIGCPALTITDEYAETHGLSAKAGALLQGFTANGMTLTQRIVL